MTAARKPTGHLQFAELVGAVQKARPGTDQRSVSSVLRKAVARGEIGRSGHDHKSLVYSLPTANSADKHTTAAEPSQSEKVMGVIAAHGAAGASSAQIVTDTGLTERVVHGVLYRLKQSGRIHPHGTRGSYVYTVASSSPTEAVDE